MQYTVYMSKFTTVYVNTDVFTYNFISVPVVIKWRKFTFSIYAPDRGEFNYG